MHMDKCTKCNGYIEDSKKLDKWLKEKFAEIHIIAHFTAEEKEKLKEVLNNNQKKICKDFEGISSNRLGERNNKLFVM